MSASSKLRLLARAEPVMLVEIELKNSGPSLYFAERQIVVAGRRYEDYIEEVRGMGYEGANSRTLSLNSMLQIRFKNEPIAGYEFLVLMGDEYPFEGAQVIIQETWLDSAGVSTTPEEVFRGTLEGPRQITKHSFISSASFAHYQLARTL